MKLLSIPNKETLIMNYCVRVDFPDDDQYVFLTYENGFNKGMLKTYDTQELAEVDAKRYPGGIVLPVKRGNK